MKERWSEKEGIKKTRGYGRERERNIVTDKERKDKQTSMNSKRRECCVF